MCSASSMQRGRGGAVRRKRLYINVLGFAAWSVVFVLDWVGSNSVRVIDCVFFCFFVPCRVYFAQQAGAWASHASLLQNVRMTWPSTSLFFVIFGNRNLASFNTPSIKSPMSAYIGLFRASALVCCSCSIAMHCGMSFWMNECSRAGPLPMSTL